MFLPFFYYFYAFLGDFYTTFNEANQEKVANTKI
jgi:hypothetical protein